MLTPQSTRCLYSWNVEPSSSEKKKKEGGRGGGERERERERERESIQPIPLQALSGLKFTRLTLRVVENKNILCIYTVLPVI